MSVRSPGPADWQPAVVSVRLSAGRNGVGSYQGDLYLTIC